MFTSFKKINIFTLMLGFYIGTPVFLLSEEVNSKYYSDKFLFCLKKEMQPIIFDSNGNAQMDGALRSFFDKYSIEKIEPWIIGANDNDRDGDVFINRIYRVYLPKSTQSSLEDIIIDIQKLSVIHSAEFENIHRINSYIPNDPRLSDQCSMGTLKAYDAWSFWNIDSGELPGDPDVLLASVDSGVEWFHPDLVDNIWNNLGEDHDGDGKTIEFIDGEWVLDPDDLNNIDNDGNGYVDDLIGWDCSGINGPDDNDPAPPSDGNAYDWSHGTHVAGSLAATTDNGIGIASAAFNSRILPVKCTRSNSTGEFINDGYSGITYAAKAGYYSGTIAIINCSWGGGGYSGYEQNIINNAHNNYGAVVLSSAGNESYNLDEAGYVAFPAEYENVLNIAASNCSGSKASFSNYGESVDLSSPGVGVLSTVMNGSYDYYDGTSMASPNAASCVGLLKSFHPGMDNDDLIERILFTADEYIYNEGLNENYQGQLGQGMVDCHKAIGYDIVPSIVYIEQNLIPLSGDGDNVVNPDESAQLAILLQNELGWTDAYNVIGILSSDNDAISITDSYHDFGDLESGEIADHDSDLFTFEISPDIEIGDIFFTLTLTAEGEGYPYTQELEIPVPISLNQEDWPKNFNQVQSSPLILDLDNDGDREIIFGDYNGLLHVVNKDGQELNGFPFDTGDDIWGSVASADLDGNGSTELIVASKSKNLYVLDSSGNVILEYDSNQFLMGTPAIGNLDNDDDLEIVVGAYTSSGDIFAINFDGTDVSGFPYSFNEKTQGLALADLNDDGIDEIIFSTESDNILGYIEIVNNEPQTQVLFTADDKFRSDPSVFNFNENYYLLSGSDDYSMYCIDLDGNLLFEIETEGQVQTSPGFVKIDDLTLGIFFGSKDGFLYGVNQNGNPLPGWPINLGGEVNSSPVFSDVDNNGIPEVIVGTALGDLVVYNLDGSLVQYFPISFGTSFISSGVVEDIDLDGDLEIFMGSTTTLTAVDIKSSGLSMGYWNMFHGNYHRSSYYEFDSIADECENLVLGDVNCDAQIDILDIILIVNIILDLSDSYNYQLTVSDLNGDLSIDIYDIIIIIGNILNN